MKPLRLKFKGINSFSEQAEIDFEKLTKDGIFGIFGDTGSGKSTILDCINFALYGKVERSKEKLDIVNYRCDCAEVEFEFDVSEKGSRKRYTVERSLKKKSGLHKAALYADDGKEVCIADNATTVTAKIEEILGVGAEDFAKCIALPQGEFSRFVKSQQSERIALIERLFSLSKYGERLKERIKEKESGTEIEYRTVSAKLSTYDDVSAELLKADEEALIKVAAEIDNLIKSGAEAEREYGELKLLGERKAELDAALSRAEALAKKRLEMEELRKVFNAVPLCRAVVDADKELSAYAEKALAADRAVNEISENIKKVQAEQDLFKAQAVGGNYDEKINDCVALAASYTSCAGKPEKLAYLERQLKEKREEYKRVEEKLSSLKKLCAAAQSDVDAAEKKLAEYGSENLDALINVRFKGAVLRGEYEDRLNYFTDLSNKLKTYEDNSKLYGFIFGEISAQKDVYRDRFECVREFSLKDAEQQIKRLQTDGEEREKRQNELNACREKLNGLVSSVRLAENELAVIKERGAELKTQAEEIVGELKKVFGAGCSDYAAVVKKNSETLLGLKREKERLSLGAEAANGKLVKLNAAKAAAEADKRHALGEAEKLNAALKDALVKSGYADVESCRKLVREFGEYSDAEKTLNEYDSELIALNSRIAELEKIDGLSAFTKDKLIAAEDKKNALSDGLVSAKERYAVLKSDADKAKERLEKKQKLLKDFSAIEKERNLIARLKEITKGNKFMEYIANEYLFDISKSASSTLLKLTDGRYFLTYTDNFFVGDNFNCGNLRGVNTLSGGETFLVSLSLALALSRSICSRSLKSIEFFFLDEGFGTLDGNLLDTVMNALEKLKSSDFTIGVISHVEELKHRINSKITVIKATESRGSCLHISC